MDIVIGNFDWMTLNSGLALLAMIFALVFGVAKPRPLKVLLFGLVVLFIPNTIYLATDLQYLPRQFARVDMFGQVLLVVQYVLLALIGIVTFLISVYQIQHFVISRTHRKHRILIFSGLALGNYLIAFGVVLGKIERTHSWYLFTNPLRVAEDVVTVLSSVWLMVAVVVAGSLINILYFSARKLVYRVTIANR